jgi:hypothetical protein
LSFRNVSTAQEVRTWLVSAPRDFWLEDWEKQATIGFHLKNPLEGCRELRSKPVLTAVGQVEVSRPYYLCPHCHNGQFSVGAS